MWWRHLVAIVALVFALFPIAYIVSAAFSVDGTLSGASLIPRDLTLDNFRTILSGTIKVAGADNDIPYIRWYANTMIIATATAISTVLVGALAAYAFSRFRFTGRRFGMLSLLLVQMFPQLLLVVAIYLIVLNTGNVFPLFGLNSLTGLTIVYLGGVLGVNIWLLKGFFDTIPAELDESARVDGATPSQVFWGVVLPVGPPRAGRGRTALVRGHGERVRDRERPAPGSQLLHAAARDALVHRQAVRGAVGAVRRGSPPGRAAGGAPLRVPAEVHRLAG